MSKGSIFSLVDHEVFALTAVGGAKESACIATWVLPSSIQEAYPECIVLSSPHNYTHELILSSKRFVLHLLAEDQATHLIHLGVDSGRQHNKLKRVPYKRAERGNSLYDIVLDGVAGYRVCQLEKTFELDERVVLVGRVITEQLSEGLKALTKSAAFAALSDSDQQILRQKQQEIAAKSRSL